MTAEGLRFFVPGLPDFVTDDELNMHFSKYGKIVDAAVARDKASGAPKGYGYVTLDAASSPDALLNDIHALGGKEIRVLLAKEALAGTDSKKVYIGNSEHLTQDEIRDAFSGFGQVWDVHTPKDPNTGVRRNFAFVTFGEVESFERAVAMGGLEVKGQQLEIKAASLSGPKSAKGKGKDGWGWDGGYKGKGKGKDGWGWDGGKGYDSWGAGGGAWGSDFGGSWGKGKASAKSGDLKKVHLDNCQNISADAIREVFLQFGPVLDVHAPRDQYTGERKRFAFVTFGSDEAMSSAISAGMVMISGEQVPVKAAVRSEGGEKGKGGDKGKGKGSWDASWSGKGDFSWGGGKGDAWGGWGGKGDAWGGWGCDASWGKGGGKDLWGKGGDSWGGKGKGKGDSMGKAGWGDDWSCGKGKGKDAGWGMARYSPY